MEEIYACLAYEPCLLDYIDFKNVSEPLWILGREYNLQKDDTYEDINEDIKSKIWFTYRKQFEPIGKTTLTSDSGWGCMHRCGQMIMAQALLLYHFGRDWRWKPDSPEAYYSRILEKFNDKPECPYSIHKIAAMGHILEKQIGQWFGPNTIVQVLKKLAEEDGETKLSVHVAMDNMVIKSEIGALFKKKCTESKNFDTPVVTEEPHSVGDDASCSKEKDEIKDIYEIDHSILLTIPLRLGLSEIIPSYFEKLKTVFKMKQSLGIIGGRTNHASYFIGYIGDELIYLDPHTTQVHIGEGPMDDSTYHCHSPSRMKFSQLDPSIALCFYMKDKNDFELWCKEAQQTLLKPEKDAMFEILEEKPAMLPFLDIEECDDFNASFTERIYTSDDEFELLM